MNHTQLQAILERSTIQAMTKDQFMAWLYDFARENFKGDINLAILELDIQGYI